MFFIPRPLALALLRGDTEEEHVSEGKKGSCGVAANEFLTFSFFTMLVQNILSNAEQNRTQSSRADITSVGSESEVGDYWNQGLIMQNTDQ